MHHAALSGKCHEPHALFHRRLREAVSSAVVYSFPLWRRPFLPECLRHGLRHRHGWFRARQDPLMHHHRHPVHLFGTFLARALYHETLLRMLDFIMRCKSPFHVVKEASDLLNENGYTKLEETKEWSLVPGGKYYVTRNESSVIAFQIPESAFSSYQIIASHSDCPTFKVKGEDPFVTDGHYTRLNVEGYGGMIRSPWFDRPLSLAGRMVVRDGNSVKSVLVDAGRTGIPPARKSGQRGNPKDAPANTSPLSRLMGTRKTRRTRSGGSWMKKLPPLSRRFLHCAWTAWGRRKLQNGSKKIKFFRLLLTATKTTCRQHLNGQLTLINGQQRR